METKINETKEFAIDTKIEYNGKLYEVVEQKYCDECSIATICANSDKTDTNPTKVLSKNKRLSIFGECSGIVRNDGKSVVFKEIPKTKEQDVYNVAPLYKFNNELMSIQIDVPKNFVIDKDNSDLTKGIIKFKNKWSTLEQLYKIYKYRAYHFAYRDSIKDFSNNKLVAIANLMDIASYFNRGWNYDFDKGETGYMIVYDTTITEPRYIVRKYDSVTRAYYGNPIFKNEADAQYVIDNPNFRDILDNIFKV